MRKLPQPKNFLEQIGEHVKLANNTNFTTPQIAQFEAQKKHIAMTGMKAIEDITGRPATWTMQQLLDTLPKWDDSSEIKEAKLQTFQDMVQTSAGVNFGGQSYTSPYGSSNADYKKIGNGVFAPGISNSPPVKSDYSHLTREQKIQILKQRGKL